MHIDKDWLLKMAEKEAQCESVTAGVPIRTKQSFIAKRQHQIEQQLVSLRQLSGS